MNASPYFNGIKLSKDLLRNTVVWSPPWRLFLLAEADFAGFEGFGEGFLVTVGEGPWIAAVKMNQLVRDRFFGDAPDSALVPKHPQQVGDGRRRAPFAREGPWSGPCLSGVPEASEPWWMLSKTP